MWSREPILYPGWTHEKMAVGSKAWGVESSWCCHASWRSFPSKTTKQCCFPCQIPCSRYWLPSSALVLPSHLSAAKPWKSSTADVFWITLRQCNIIAGLSDDIFLWWQPIVQDILHYGYLDVKFLPEFFDICFFLWFYLIDKFPEGPS